MGKENDTKNYILEEAFLQRCVEKYDGIVIYGIGKYGKSMVDYLVFHGAKDKIKAVVVTALDHTEASYEGIDVMEAHTFFIHEKNRQQFACGGGGIA